MSGIRGKDTSPELLVRRSLHRQGLRFRLHRSDLVGCPDLVFPKFGVALFVHGCFWHGHGCKVFRWPKENADFWKTKIDANRLRDQSTCKKLRLSKWRVLIVWECQLRKSKKTNTLDAMAQALAAKIRGTT